MLTRDEARLAVNFSSADGQAGRRLNRLCSAILNGRRLKAFILSPDANGLLQMRHGPRNSFQPEIIWPWWTNSIGNLGGMTGRGNECTDYFDCRLLDGVFFGLSRLPAFIPAQELLPKCPPYQSRTACLGIARRPHPWLKHLPPARPSTTERFLLVGIRSGPYHRGKTPFCKIPPQLQ